MILFTGPLLLLLTNKPAHDRTANTYAAVGDSIQFNFTHIESSGFSSALKIRGSISNNGPKTIYFLSYSCDGMQDFVVCDTNFFQPERMMQCNMTIPIKIELKPGKKKEFIAHFMPRTKQNNPLILAYKLVLLDRQFNMDSVLKARNFDFRKLPFLLLKGTEE